MLTDTLQSLEREARLLEPSAEQRARVRGAVINYTEGFLGEIEHRKAFDERAVADSAWAAAMSPNVGGSRSVGLQTIETTCNPGEGSA